MFNDQKTLRCISDETSGTDAHEEIFELRGTNAGKDVLDVQGSGRSIRDVQAFSSNQSELSNPTFSQYTFAGGTAAVGVPVTGTVEW